MWLIPSPSQYFFCLLVRSKVLGTTLVVWSLVNGYTRIYLGLHYPFDVLTGLAWGTAVGFLVYWLLHVTYKRLSSVNNYVSTQYTSTGYSLDDVDIVELVFFLTIIYTIIRASYYLLKKMDTKHIQIKDFNYNLPDERIAKFPLAKRDNSKLLLYRHGEVTEDVFHNIAQYLPMGALMVFNNTKVIQARLHFRKETGALIEVFLLEPYMPADYEQMFQTTGHCSWLCMIGNLKKWKEGTLKRTFDVKGKEVTLVAERKEDVHKSYRVDFSWDASDVSWAELLDAVGELPIPPYLNRETQESDKTTYQTVYSKIKGSVAAPTAGLHFTPEVLADIDRHGIDREELTLHVGAGTFKPVKSEEIQDHEMHTEYICVHRQTLEKAYPS